ncbi:MAG TPA: metal ABC transporter permease, partial [bacterium]|nr:metal ABC transporter permease [bacterium]
RKFLFISFDPETAVTAGINVKLYEFLFYFILGTVISFAIRSAGVLLTFGYLAAPASLALLFRERMKDVFLFAVLTGLSATLIGLVLSFFWDLPSGTTIVALMGIAWFAGYIFKR